MIAETHLASAFIQSPNYTPNRPGSVSRITPHYMAGNMTARDCAVMFQNSSRKASSQYCIGSDGDIVQCVSETDVAWTSGSYYNDSKAITIECANLSDDSLTFECWESLVKLCVDICKRYGFRLNYTGDDSGNLTMHKWYQSTSCPGSWLSYKFDVLAATVNNILDSENGDEDMNALACFFRPDADPKKPIIFYDGVYLHDVEHPDEQEAINKVARNTIGHDLPLFELGSKDAPYGTRFMQVVERRH